MRFDLISDIKGDNLLIPFTDSDSLNKNWGEFIDPAIKGLKPNHCLSVLDGKSNTRLHFLALGSQGNSVAHRAIRSFMIKKSFLVKNELTVDLRHLTPEYLFESVLGIRLSGYSPGRMKTEPEETDWSKLEVLLITPSGSEIEPMAKIVESSVKTAEAVSDAMFLVDTPSNIKTPQYISKWVLDSIEPPSLNAKVLRQESLKDHGLKALLAVGQGSIHPPELVCLEYQADPEAGYHLGLVGKGITFDTGGVSLKKPSNMHYMKSDMGGAAAILGAMKLIAALELPLNVVAVIPLAENTIDAHSIKPGDVISSYSGKTIEVIDTDAEGRLILADALVYINQNYSPETIIDLATLTGSAVAALGYHAAALFTNDQQLGDTITAAGQQVQERVWPMPLWSDYEEDLHSDVADVRNYSGKPIAGAIMAAKFLEFFIKDHPRWAHLDIAGVAFGNTDHAKMKSATGFGVRLLAKFAEQISKYN